MAEAARADAGDVRIVGGRLRGRRLQAPSSHAIRPTSDRLRESLFNILMHWQGTDLVRDARVIDLFAGTGALGLEALSRGARFTLFVEEGSEARALLRENVHALGLAGSTRIVRRDATQLGAAATEPFTLAFLDPPYGKGLASPALQALDEGGWLLPGAVVVVEEASASPVAAPPRFVEADVRQQGDTSLRFYVAAPVRGLEAVDERFR